MCPVDKAQLEAVSRGAGKFRVATRLLGNRQRIMCVLLTMERVAVGICDLLVAASMYLLFLLLQGRPPAHPFRGEPKTTLSAALITAILVVFRALMDLFSEHSVVRQIQNIYTDFLLRLTQGYSEMQWGRFVECNRGELTNHTLHTAREAADFYHRCIEMTAAVAVVAIMASAIVYQSPIAALGFGCALAAFYGVHRFLIRAKLQKAASSREKSQRALQRDLAGMLSSGKEIRTYRNQAFFRDRIRLRAERLAVSNLHVHFLPRITRIVADQGAVLLFLCIIIAVQLRQGDARQVLSLLAFYFVLSRRLLPLISEISFTAGQMESSYENVRIVDSELNECRGYRTPALLARLPGAGLALDIQHVSFSFRQGVPVLQDVNLCLHKGETAVLHGPSGIGKSSLLDLIAGVSQPDAGVVRVDRSSIAYVPQEVPLLDDSIRNNLLFGLPERSDEELMRALAIARLHEFVAGQPRGLETSVGDNGALFSGGQRQRLGLARAILRGAQLLLLDEATSALDEENERQVLENLNATRMAVLLVTHRAHNRVFAHRVFRLQEGRLIEESSRQITREEHSLPAGVGC